MNQTGITPIFILCGIVLLIGLIGGAYYLGTQNTQSNRLNQIQVLPTPAPTNHASPAVSPLPRESDELTKPCKNEVMGFQIMIPETWSCKSENMAATDGTVDIKSDFYDITISTLGRGPYCATPSSGCVVTNFYSNNNISTEMWSYDNEDKEIFGSIKNVNLKPNTNQPWISIKYKDMENKKLTSEQKNELIKILDSIKPLN